MVTYFVVKAVGCVSQHVHVQNDIYHGLSGFSIDKELRFQPLFELFALLALSSVKCMKKQQKYAFYAGSDFEL